MNSSQQWACHLLTGKGEQELSPGEKDALERDYGWAGIWAQVIDLENQKAESQLWLGNSQDSSEHNRGDKQEWSKIAAVAIFYILVFIIFFLFTESSDIISIQALKLNYVALLLRYSLQILHQKPITKQHNCTPASLGEASIE